MSEKKTWIGKVLAAIIEVFASNWQSFVAKLWKKVPDELQEKVSLAVKIVEAIKVWVESPTADILTAIIPGDLDDKLKDWLRLILPVILEKYNVVNQSKLAPEASHIIATNITQELTDLSFGQAALTTEVAYQNLKA